MILSHANAVKEGTGELPCVENPDGTESASEFSTTCKIKFSDVMSRTLNLFHRPMTIKTG